MKIIFKSYIFLLLLLGCKDQEIKTKNLEKPKPNIENKKEQYSFELEDSDESYVMDNWSQDKKNEYYNETVNLIVEFLSGQNYNAPNENLFSKQLKEQLNIDVKKDSLFMKLPFLNSNSEFEKENLIIFPKQKIVAFESELPLINKANIEFYHSKDYKSLDNSKSYNVVINKLLFDKTLSDIEIDEYLLDKSLNDLFICLITNYHFTGNNKILKSVVNNFIQKIEKGEDLNSDIFESLFYKKNSLKEEFEIDNLFLKRIVAIDKNKILLPQFLLISQFEQDITTRKKISETVKDAYAIER